MFAFVIFFGLFHALVFLPLACSVIGAMPDADASSEKKKVEGKSKEGDINGITVTKL